MKKLSLWRKPKASKFPFWKTMAADPSEGVRVVVLHDTDGRPYFKALHHLKSEGVIKTLTYRESSVVRWLLRHLSKGSLSLKMLKRALKNVAFRFMVPCLRGRTIVLGMAHFEFRIIWYGHLCRLNRVIYQTSWPDWQGRVPRNYGPFNLFSKLVWKHFLTHPHVTVVGVTKGAQKSVSLFAGNHKQSHHLPHTSNLGALPPPRQSPQGVEFKVIFVGKLIPEKGVRLLAQLMARLDTQVSFCVVGSGPMGPELTKFRQNHRVQVLGYVNDFAQLRKLYETSHVLVAPSLATRRWEELFGIAIAEAMSFGVVPLASPHVGPKSIFEHGVSGFHILEHDFKAYEGKILRLRDSPEEWLAMSKACQERAQDFLLPKVAKGWQELLKPT
jgi:glycosyltransferase involved in cell wall biosynthesis